MNREALIAHLDEHGYVVLEGALTPDHANQLRDRSAELITQEREAGGEYLYLDDKSQRVWNLVNKGRISEEMSCSGSSAARSRSRNRTCSGWRSRNS